MITDVQAAGLHWQNRHASASWTTMMTLASSNGYLGIGTPLPAKRIEALDATYAQLRLTQTAGSVYTDFTTDPSGQLTIVPSGSKVWVKGGNIAYTGIGNLVVQSTDSYAIDKGGMLTLSGIYTGTTVSQFASISGRKENGTDNNYAGYMQFATADYGVRGWGLLESMRITSAGLLGVNTTTPRRKLDVLDASNPQLRLSHTDNSVYTDFKTDSSGYLTIAPSGGRTFLADNGGGYGILGTQGATHLALYTTNVHRLTLQADGSLFYPQTDNVCGLGTSTQRWTTIYGYYAGATGTRFTNGYYTNITSTNAVTVDSDERWKEDISDTYGLSLVQSIPARSFKWRKDSGRADGVRHSGFVAQEFRDKLQDLGITDTAIVRYDKENDEYGLATGELIPILWTAVQELSAKVAALEAA